MRGSGRIEDVTALVGRTPLVRLRSIERTECPGVELYLKLEYTNPGGSVKDRPALRMIQDALADGRLRPGKILIDSTSGNTGVAYSLFGAALGIPVHLVMPSNVTQARKDIARAFGTAEEDLFDYLEGRMSLAEFSKLRERAKREAGAGAGERKSPRERAIELVVADGYGSAIEIRRAAARAREALPAEKQESLGVLEWANLIETTLRQMRRENDPAGSSGVRPRARAEGASPARAKGRHTA